MPQQRKKEESVRLRGERDQTKFIDLGFVVIIQTVKRSGKELENYVASSQLNKAIHN